MKSVYLLVGAERGDAFWQKIVTETCAQTTRRILWADTFAAVTAERIVATKGVIIPLTPGPFRWRCLGIEWFLRVKRMEAAIGEKNDKAARVMPTLFCSFLSCELFEEVFTTRFGSRFGVHLLDSLCANHLRMPFDVCGLADGLALADSSARRLSRRRHRPIYLHAISQLNQAYLPHQKRRTEITKP